MLAGVLDYLTERHPGSTLLGFKGGPGGILAKDYMEITQDNMVSSNLDRRREASHHQAAALRILEVVSARGRLGKPWHADSWQIGFKTIMP